MSYGTEHWTANYELEVIRHIYTNVHFFRVVVKRLRSHFKYFYKRGQKWCDLFCNQFVFHNSASKRSINPTQLLIFGCLMIPCDEMFSKYSRHFPPFGIKIKQKWFQNVGGLGDGFLTMIVAYYNGSNCRVDMEKMRGAPCLSVANGLIYH